jgi:hypothetical protein
LLRKRILYNIGERYCVEKFEGGIRQIVKDNEEALEVRKAALALDYKWDAFVFKSMRSFHEDFRQSIDNEHLKDDKELRAFLDFPFLCFE